MFLQFKHFVTVFFFNHKKVFDIKFIVKIYILWNFTVYKNFLLTTYFNNLLKACERLNRKKF